MTDMHNNKQDDDGVHNLLKFVEQRPEHNETTHPKNYWHHYQPEKISLKVINLSNLTKHEIEILKLGLSFTPTAKDNISALIIWACNFVVKRL